MPTTEGTQAHARQSYTKRDEPGQTVYVDKTLKADIISALSSPRRKQSPFDAPLEYLGAARIAFLNEEWNLCVVQSIIAIESALSAFVLKSNLSGQYRRKKALNRAEVIDHYMRTQRLHSRFSKFLFPILLATHQSHTPELIRKLLRKLFGPKSNQGIYALRNRIVHEGATAIGKEATSALGLASDFISVLTTTATFPLLDWPIP